MMANLVWTNETVSEMYFIEELSGPLCSSEVLILLAISGSILELLMLIIPPIPHISLTLLLYFLFKVH